MPRYLGPGQIAECQRCGEKGFAADLVRDGRNPSLLVFADCYDPVHPLEQPFVVSDTDGVAKHEIAPQQLPSTAPVLTAEKLTTPDRVSLTWTLADSASPAIDTYTVYRSDDDGPFEALASYSVDFGSAPRYTPTVTQTFEDTDVTTGVHYTYEVEATAHAGSTTVKTLTSNAEAEYFDPPPPGYTFTSGSRGDFGTMETGVDKGHTLSSGTQAYGTEVGNTTGLAFCKVNQEVASGLPSAFAVAIDGVVAQNAFTSITFTSDMGAVVFLSANASFGTSSGPDGAYGEWVWIAPNGDLYFTDGLDYTLTVT